MITLRNIALWDARNAVTRIPSIVIDPVQLNSMADDDRWIICGPWKIKVTVVPSDKGGLSVAGAGGTVQAAGISGSIFIDDSMFEIQSVGENLEVLGRVRGCFDIEW